jgi:hypothetical protein
MNRSLKEDLELLTPQFFVVQPGAMIKIHRPLTWKTSRLMFSFPALTLAFCFAVVIPATDVLANRSQQRRQGGRQSQVTRVQGLPLLPEVAKEAWKLSPKAEETTKTFTARVEADLGTLLAKPRAKLNAADGGWWRRLAYLHAMPYDKMPEVWKVWYLENMPNGRLSGEQRDDLIKRLEKIPLWQMTPKQADVWLNWIHETTPDLRDRVIAIARKNLRQPYRMYLLGEFPYEMHDPEPTLDLTHGDCVVFSEHTYAMALSSSWSEFYKALQSIRYRDGVIGMTTRNHYTVADWNTNNSWLVEDITRSLGATTVTRYVERVDRGKFFANFGIEGDFPIDHVEDFYIPHDAIEGVLEQLQPGDFINVVRGRPGSGA